MPPVQQHQPCDQTVSDRTIEMSLPKLDCNGALLMMVIGEECDDQ